MTINEKKTDTGLLAMINNALSGKWHVPEEDNAGASDTPPEPGTIQPILDHAEVPMATGPAALGSPPSQGRRALSADQMQKVIRKALAELPEFGDGRGVNIIVYGYQPWNALVSFEANSVASSAARVIKQAAEIAVEALRQDYDVTLPPT